MRLNNSGIVGSPVAEDAVILGFPVGCDVEFGARQFHVRPGLVLQILVCTLWLEDPIFWLRWKYYARNAADSPVDKFEDALESSVNRFHDHTAFDVFREIRGCVPYPDGADESGPVFECVGDAVAFVVCHDGSFFDCFFMWTVVVDCG